MKYTGRADIGKGNRYVGVHPYFFMAALLDPCIKDHLFGDCVNGEYMMVKEDYERLKSDLLQFMVEQKRQ